MGIVVDLNTSHRHNFNLLLLWRIWRVELEEDNVTILDNIRLALLSITAHSFFVLNYFA